MKKLKSLKTALLNIPVTSVLAILLVFGVIFGCKKDETTSTHKAYKNMDDATTTNIIASIPRIELSKLKSTQISLYLSVTDQNGKPFSEFNKYNFVIKQVCVGQQDTTVVASLSFSKLNQTGSNIATPLVLDYSGSMDSYIGDLEQAAGNFISIKNNSDQIELVKFSTEIENVQPFSNDTVTLLQALHNWWANAGNTTAFYDAMMMGVNDAETFNQAHSTFLPAVIGFTDGLDNASSIYYSELINQALARQIPLYTIGFGDADEAVLNTIATQTGGRYYYTPDITTLKTLFSLISGQLKNLYMVSWVYDDQSCSEVLITVEAKYTCANGSYASKTQKIFHPLVK
ncbi:MAG: VWA domain-containing protein [Bacteroidetes bacterium]|nr:VWA domain-containing protein [Bacteroidota bacterium]